MLIDSASRKMAQSCLLMMKSYSNFLNLSKLQHGKIKKDKPENMYVHHLNMIIINRVGDLGQKW